mgnify:CR=1 FL=1
MLDITIKEETECLVFEDKNPESPTYGAIKTGKQGLQYATEMNDGQWKWKNLESEKIDIEKGKWESDARRIKADTLHNQRD